MASQRQDKRQDKIDLNRASTDEIARIAGFDERRALLIVEARKKRGRFHGWDEVEAIPGVGPALLEKLQAAATIGGGNGGGRRSAQRVGDGGAELQKNGVQAQVEQADETDEEEEGADDQADVEGAAAAGEDEDEMDAEEMDAEETMLMALMAVAEMDLGAAAAYEIGAGCFEETDDEVRDQLLSFRADHLRHAAEIDLLVMDLGGEPLERPEPAESVLARLAEAAAALGPRATMLAMLSNEQLTNSTYASLLDLEWDDRIRAILESNREDEARHLRWLEQHRARAEELDALAGAPA